jgi:hypothetical protein
MRSAVFRQPDGPMRGEFAVSLAAVPSAAHKITVVDNVSVLIKP